MSSRDLCHSQPISLVCLERQTCWPRFLHGITTIIHIVYSWLHIGGGGTVKSYHPDQQTAFVWSKISFSLLSHRILPYHECNPPSNSCFPIQISTYSASFHAWILMAAQVIQLSFWRLGNPTSAVYYILWKPAMYILSDFKNHYLLWLHYYNYTHTHMHMCTSATCNRSTIRLK